MWGVPSHKVGIEVLLLLELRSKTLTFVMFGEQRQGLTVLRLMFRRPKRVIFSMVELLIVIAILAILMSLLLPSLNGALYSAKLSECQFKLKHKGMVFPKEPLALGSL